MAINEVNSSYGISENLIERFKTALDMDLKTQLKKIFSSLHPADQAELIYNLAKEDREHLIEILKSNIEPELLVELEGDVRHEIINYLDKDTLANLLIKLDTDDVVDILENFQDDLTHETIESIKSNKKREDIEEALSYPEDSVGRIMNQDKFIAVPKNWTINELIKYLRKNRNVPQEFGTIVVVDEYYRPVSTASVGNILKSDSTKLISDVMSDPEEVKIINANIDQSDAARIFSKYDLKFVPVVNDNGVLIGILTSNDIMHVINEEAREDMMLMANLNSDDTIYTTIVNSVKRRVPWLFGSIITASLSTIVINHFSFTIQNLVILSAIMPLIANLSGVSGTQSLTILVRNLNTNKNITGVPRIIFKEMLVGFLNGLLLATFAATILFLWKGDAKLSFIFGITIVILQTISCCIGSSVPLILSKLKLDPAVGSGTFITATLDTLSSLLLLTMATNFLL